MICRYAGVVYNIDYNSNINNTHSEYLYIQLFVSSSISNKAGSYLVLVTFLSLAAFLCASSSINFS